MAEYIEREAALKAIAEDKIEMTPELIAIGRAIGTYTAEQAFDGINQACDRHIESIKILPAADIQPVKHGRWKRKRETLGRGPLFAEICVWQCTACKCVTPVEVDRYKYCPNCGARMDGKT